MKRDVSDHLVTWCQQQVAAAAAAAAAAGEAGEAGVAAAAAAGEAGEAGVAAAAAAGEAGEAGVAAAAAACHFVARMRDVARKVNIILKYAKDIVNNLIKWLQNIIWHIIIPNASASKLINNTNTTTPSIVMQMTDAHIVRVLVLRLSDRARHAGKYDRNHCERHIMCDK